MARMLRLHGGELEGLYVEESKVIDGKYKAHIERANYKPECDAESIVFSFWRVALDVRDSEMTVVYEMRNGNLCHAQWPTGLKFAA